MNSSDLFYVRNLQTKFYFKKNEIVRSLFFLENYLFSLPKLTSNFVVYKDSVLKEKVLKFIEYFSQILDETNLVNVFNIFKKLNTEFNSIITKSESNFLSSVYFQFFQYLYKENFKNRKELLNLFLNTQLKINDNFEYVFAKLFFKFFIKKNKKLSRTIYLFYLLVCFFKKDEIKSC